MQWSGADESRRDEGRVEFAGFLERTGVDVLDGVQLGPVLVVGLDAVQVEPDQCAARDLAGRQGRVGVVDRGLGETKALRTDQAVRQE